ncbi:FAD-dependent oxidoreductase [Actinocatenispora sera]|uniref:Flavoprotein n=1 Tax=Actinocatenispora sera TaxID=390989 RepID=A0A810KY06_9ACTN|nr:FAD-dependent oxidoreductase [Actinocatenispora sera]BCJ27312.1 flavoprotein [Actinocatenispora sera]
MIESPVVVIGAGPIGLAAAAHLTERGLPALVLEAGERAGAAVHRWGHVRLFSPWSQLVDPAAARALQPTGWQAPAGDAYPTGADWANAYLQPLADTLGDTVRFGTRVIGVSRQGRDRVVDAGRDTTPFVVHTREAGGREGRILARAVIDASGTWQSPNPLGADGLPAAGETDAAEAISYRIPDLTDPAVAARYAGRHTAVAGSGHSALTALVGLAELAATAPGTRISWLLRRGQTGAVFGGGAADELAARGALGQRAQAAVQAGHITTVTGFRTDRLDPAGDRRWAVVADDGRRIEQVDQIVAVTGFRPDHRLLSEIRLGVDPTLQAPTALAPLIDPNVHSCGTVYPHGVAELAHPEPDFYLAGMKSYGRAPTFLALTGYEQVRSIVAALAGDHDAAHRVELTLPDTGVCGGSGVFDDPTATGGCCTTSEPELIALPTLRP